jgi:hypothetical protein
MGLRQAKRQPIAAFDGLLFIAATFVLVALSTTSAGRGWVSHNAATPQGLNTVSVTRTHAALRANHALDFIGKKRREAAAAYALYGDEPFLKQLVLEAIRGDVLDKEDEADADWSLRRVAGKNAELRDVLDELSTPALFGGGTRLVVVDEGDKFVSEHRQALEEYVAAPSRSGVLVLTVDSWPSNTRLAESCSSLGSDPVTPTLV